MKALHKITHAINDSTAYLLMAVSYARKMFMTLTTDVNLIKHFWHDLRLCFCHKQTHPKYTECRYAECRYAESRGTNHSSGHGCLFQKMFATFNCSKWSLCILKALHKITHAINDSTAYLLMAVSYVRKMFMTLTTGVHFFGMIYATIGIFAHV